MHRWGALFYHFPSLTDIKAALRRAAEAATLQAVAGRDGFLLKYCILPMVVEDGYLIGGFALLGILELPVRQWGVDGRFPDTSVCFEQTGMCLLVY